MGLLVPGAAPEQKTLGAPPPRFPGAARLCAGGWGQARCPSFLRGPLSGSDIWSLPLDQRTQREVPAFQCGSCHDPGEKGAGLRLSWREHTCPRRMCLSRLNAAGDEDSGINVCGHRQRPPRPDLSGLWFSTEKAHVPKTPSVLGEAEPVVVLGGRPRPPLLGSGKVASTEGHDGIL